MILFLFIVAIKFDYFNIQYTMESLHISFISKFHKVGNLSGWVLLAIFDAFYRNDRGVNNFL